MPLDHGHIRPRTFGFGTIFLEILTTQEFLYMAIIRNYMEISPGVYFQTTVPISSIDI